MTGIRTVIRASVVPGGGRGVQGGDSLECGRNLRTGCSSQVKKSARRIPSMAVPSAAPRGSAEVRAGEHGDVPTSAQGRG